MLFSYQLSWPSNPGRFIWADIDGDAAADLITAGGISIGFISTDDPISLPLPSALSLPAASISAAGADFNADGNGDVAFATADGRVFVLTGTSSGTFSVLTTLNIPSVSKVYSVDLWGDQHPDLLVFKSGSTQVEIYSNNAGVFSSSGTVELGTTGVVKVVSGRDFNGDGIKDAAILTDLGNVVIITGGPLNYSSQTISVSVNCVDMTWFPNATGTYKNLMVIDSSNGVYQVASDDMTTFTMTALGSITGNISKIASAGKSSLSEPVLVSWDTTLQQFQIWEWSTDHFINQETVSPGCNVTSIYQGDHDNNGLNDIIVLCSDGLSIKWVHEGESGDLELHSRVRTTVYGSTMCISGQMNSDNIQDLVCFDANQKLSRIITVP